MKSTKPEILTTRAQLIAELQAKGVHDPRWLDHLVLCLAPGGEKEVLPGETREAAIARLMRHYEWDERTAGWTIALSEGWSDIVPLDDDGTPLPYYRVMDDSDDDMDHPE
jgi:hypothetical protein